MQQRTLAPVPFRGSSPLRSYQPPPPLPGSYYHHHDHPVPEVPDLTPDNSPTLSSSSSPTDNQFDSRQTYSATEDMGFFKKKGDRKGKDTPEPQNPYAEQSAQDAYTGQAPPRYDGGNHVDRAEKSPAYTTQAQHYGNGGSYGQNGAYGSDRFNGSAKPSPARQGGYGGLGPAEDRNALFGAAPDRYQHREPPVQSGVSNQNGGYGGYGQGDSYGNGLRYDDLELTEEQKEEQLIDATKSEIKQLRNESASMSSNALRLALQAEETGRGTLARLGAQREQLYNAERNLDLAASQSKVALENSKVLETAAHMIHAPHLRSSKAREAARQDRLVANAAAEREQREAVRREGLEANRRLDAFNKNSRGANGPQAPQSTLADRGRYLFEGDSDDDELEGQIENNLSQLHYAAQRLNQLALATHDELDGQIKQADRMGGKSDGLDGSLTRNVQQLKRVSERN